MLTPGKIGRPAADVSGLEKDGWKFVVISLTGEGTAPRDEQTIVSKITFGDPVVRVSAGSEYWFSWRYKRRSKFNDTNGALEFELAENGDAAKWDRQIVNNGVDRCLAGKAALIGEGVAPLIHIPAGEADGRCRICAYRNVDLGTTVCADSGNHLFKVLLNGTIENIDLDSLSIPFGTVNVTVKDL